MIQMVSIRQPSGLRQQEVTSSKILGISAQVLFMMKSAVQDILRQMT
jgi:hypothetical protein